MKNITTIFFDIDNTLINHSGAEKQAIKETKNHYLPQRSNEEFMKVWIEQTANLWKRYEKHELTFQEQRTQRILAIWKFFGEQITPDTANSIFNYYLISYEKSWKVFPNVLETLEVLKHKGIKIGVISNGNKDQQIHKLKQVGIYEYLEKDLCIVSEEVGFAKPNQEIFSFAQNKTRAKPSEILFIGDSLTYDIEPATKAGWHTQLIDYFNKYPEEKAIKAFSLLSTMLADNQGK